MNSKVKFIGFLFIFIGLFTLDLDSCTTFCFKDKNGNIFFGRNYDFQSGIGFVHINQKNLQKSSRTGGQEEPFKWVSKYGSITFNQNGKEFPYGGINEAGLIIEQMGLPDTKYPAKDSRYGLTNLQWIQYQLDVSASVDDVIKSDSKLRISTSSQVPLHFSVADLKGNFATIEYLEGKMVYHTGKDALHHVLANDTYEKSLADKAVNDNKSRFVRAANMIETYDKSKGNGVEYAFDILKNVKDPVETQWSIVYDLKKRMIYYKTLKNPSIRQIDLSKFNFDCSSERLFIDIDDNVNNEKDFNIYNWENNLKSIDKAWNSISFLKGIPAEARMRYAKYPDEAKCLTNK